MNLLPVWWTFLLYEQLERAVPEAHRGEFLELEQSSVNTGDGNSFSLLLTLDD